MQRHEAKAIKMTLKTRIFQYDSKTVVQSSTRVGEFIFLEHYGICLRETHAVTRYRAILLANPKFVDWKITRIDLYSNGCHRATLNW